MQAAKGQHPGPLSGGRVWWGLHRDRGRGQNSAVNMKQGWQESEEARKDETDEACYAGPVSCGAKHRRNSSEEGAWASPQGSAAPLRTLHVSSVVPSTGQTWLSPIMGVSQEE